MQIALSKFLQGVQLKSLTLPSIDRSEIGDTSQVNAQYSGATNSISICAGTTQPPFYDASWPTAINFGAIGMVVGHEITHGFDTNGVQWNSVGAYGNWLDKDSQKAFEEMAKCVVNQYNDLCIGNYCVNGDLTQAENIADNGGIQAAFRSYRSHVGLYGEDAALPGEVAGQFTNDQLFFVGYARTWCNYYYASPETYDWNESHSPGPIRVLGTLQNFDEFRAAFNCPLNSKYAPKDKCDVWITDVEAHLDVPTPKALLPQINLPAPPVVTANNTDYKEVTDYFSKTIDITQQPCNKFYEYTCNKLGSKMSNIQSVNLNVAKTIANAISTPSLIVSFHIP